MKEHDQLTKEQSEAAYEAFTQQYLAAVPDANMQEIVFNAVVNHGIANVTGLTYANLSIYTRLQAIQAALSELPAPAEPEPIIELEPIIEADAELGGFLLNFSL